MDLIEKLLDKDPAKRLGSSGSSDEILAHPWFADLDIGALMAKKIDPPYKPGNQDGTVNTDYFAMSANASALVESAVDEENQQIVKQN